MRGLPWFMDEKVYDVEAVKHWLKSYVDNEREIDNQIERLEHITARMVGVGAQVITDMPRAHSASTDRMADCLAQKEELEKEIRESISEQSVMRNKIEGFLKELRNPDERAVIQMRYLDRSSWTEVRDMMFGHRDDFCDKEETYLRRTHRIHGSALVNIAKLVSERGMVLPVPESLFYKPQALQFFQPV